VGLTREQRQAQREQERGQNRAVPYPIAAPIGGLNARDALAAMAETDAIILDNWFCQPSWVEFRKGEATQATFAGQCPTVMGYRGALAQGNYLFGAVANGATYSIYRVDNTGGGAVGSPVVGGAGGTVQALHSATFDYNQFGSGSGEFLWALNASDQDLPLLFDGSTWNAVGNSGGTYQLTNGPSGGSNAGLMTLSQVAVYKQRLWFLQQGTFQVYYLPQLQASGALTQLNLGADFKLGGYLVAMVTVSVDNTAGLNDFMAFCSSMGEVVVYQGYDPSQESTWSIAAHFVMGRLLNTGRRAWVKVGADAVLLTVDGAVLISQAMLTDRSSTRQAVTDKIRQGLNNQVQTTGTLAGWQMQLYPFGTKLMILNPTSNASSFLWVQNTLSGAWSTFGQYASSWNAFCLEMWGDNLYVGQNGAVSQVDTGLSDNGAAITFTVKPAFSQHGEPGHLKRWTMFQPIFQVTGTLQLALSFNVDFSVTAPTGAIPVSTGAGSPWNTSYWGPPGTKPLTYWGDATLISKPWLGLNGEGYWGTVYMQAAAVNLTCKWSASNFLHEPGGVLYGKA
jgi:hypothetical protein